MTDIERIRQANDIADVVGEHLTLKKAGNAYKGLCPFHNEKTPSFTVNPARQTFKCFGCGAGGDVFKFIQLRENVDFGQALRTLADRGGIQISEHRGGGGSAGGPNRATLIRANEWAAGWFVRQIDDLQIGESARKYVQYRQIDPDVARRFNLGFAPDSFDQIIRDAGPAGFDRSILEAAGLVRTNDRGQCYSVFRNRLMFGIRDSSGRLIGFGGRALGDAPAKYINSPETVLFEKGRQVFGLDQARKAVANKKRVVVVEGYTDCLMAHQFGFDETVAALGTSFTEQQVRLLARFSDELVLVFDSDEAGQRAADRAMEAALAQRLNVRLACLPHGKDPCDFLLSAGAERFEALLNSATEALEFKWHQVKRLSHASGGTADSQRSVEGFLGLVARSVARESVDSVHLGFIAGRVGKLLAQPADEIFRYIKKLKDRERRQGPRISDAPATAKTPASADIDEKSVRVILEVLLNAPEHAALVRDRRVVDRIRDRSLARIAKELLTACPDGQAFELAGFVSRFEEPEMAALIIDLHHRGACRGNLEDTLVTTLNRLEVEQRTRDYDWPGTGEEMQSRTQLHEVSKGTESRHLFHPKRHTKTLSVAYRIADPALSPPDTEPAPRART